MDLAQIYFFAVRAPGEGQKLWPVVLKSTAAAGRPYAQGEEFRNSEMELSTEFRPEANPSPVFSRTRGWLRDWKY